jgi:hypothetical protein
VNVNSTFKVVGKCRKCGHCQCQGTLETVVLELRLVTYYVYNLIVVTLLTMHFAAEALLHWVVGEPFLLNKGLQRCSVVYWLALIMEFKKLV